MPPPPGPGTVCETEEQAAGAAAGPRARNDQPGATMAATMGASGGHDAPGHDLPGPGFHWMVLQRHGRRPLAVLGRTLLRANNRCVGLPCWSEITIQETAAARFAACLRHTPPCQGDPVWRDAWLCDSVEAVRAALRAHDPLLALPPPFPADAIGLESIGPESIGPESEGAAAALFGHDRFHQYLETTRRFRAAWAGLLAALFGLADRTPQDPSFPARPRLA